MADARRTRTRWIAGGVAGVVLVVAGGVAAHAVMSGGSASADFRTSVVATGPVTQTLVLPGTVQRVNQVTATFPTSGTVTSVPVAVGASVRAGQTLATMDPTALEAALLAARATSAQDQATLASDESGSGGGSSAAATRTPSSSPARASADLAGPLSQADSSLAAVQRLLEQVGTLCTPIIGTITPSPADGGGRDAGGAGIHRSSDIVPLAAPATATATPSPTPSDSPAPSPTPSPGSGDSPAPSPSPSGSSTPGGSPSPTPSPSPSDSPSPTPTPSPSDGGAPGSTSTGGSGDSNTPTPAQISACVSAMSRTAQALQTTERAVASIVQRLSVTSEGASGRGSTSTATGGAAASASRSTDSSSSATRVAADEVALLQDEQSVSQAQANLDAATLTAPIAGVVGEIDLTPGRTASASSGIVIVGPGAAVVTVDVPLAQMPTVHAGLTAHVTPAGAVASLPATIQSVDLLPSSGDSSSPAYPATVLVPNPVDSLASGSSATVSVTVGSAADALRIPASAMSGRTGDAGTVTVLVDGKATPTPVTVGAVGGGWAQVLSGLTAGQQVVLADASQTLPSNTAAGGGGGFGGGGFVRRGAVSGTTPGGGSGGSAGGSGTSGGARTP